MKIKLEYGSFKPERAHKDDAGLDIKTPYRVVLAPGSRYNVDTGIHIEIPSGYVGMIKSKSGLNTKKGLICEGVIDSGYIGSIVVSLYNSGNNDIDFKRGDKIAQLVILPILIPELEYVDTLEETERGTNGFGSTGK